MGHTVCMYWSECKPNVILLLGGGCCNQLQISAPRGNALDTIIRGKYIRSSRNYGKTGKPYYKRTSPRTMHIFYRDNRWVMEEKLGDVGNFISRKHGWIRYNGKPVCPDAVPERQWEPGCPRAWFPGWACPGLGPIKVECTGASEFLSLIKVDNTTSPH